MFAIGKLTFRSILASPVALAVAALLGIAIALAPRLVLFGFGDDARIVRETGASTLRLAALLVALAAGLRGAGDRSALTLILSRPLTPSGALLGRFGGALVTAILMLSMLSAVLYGTLTANAMAPAGVFADWAAASLDAAILVAAAVALGTLLSQALASLALLALFSVAHAAEGARWLLASDGRPLAAALAAGGYVALGAAVAEAREPGATR